MCIPIARMSTAGSGASTDALTAGTAFGTSTLGVDGCADAIIGAGTDVTSLEGAREQAEKKQIPTSARSMARWISDHATGGIISD